MTKYNGPTLRYVGHNETDQTITVLIGYTRYEYRINDGYVPALRTYQQIRSHSEGKALAWLKKRADSFQKV